MSALILPVFFASITCKCLIINSLAAGQQSSPNANNLAQSNSCCAQGEVLHVKMPRGDPEARSGQHKQTTQQTSKNRNLRCSLDLELSLSLSLVFPYHVTSVTSETGGMWNLGPGTGSGEPRGPKRAGCAQHRTTGAERTERGFEFSGRPWFTLDTKSLRNLVCKGASEVLLCPFCASRDGTTMLQNITARAPHSHRIFCAVLPGFNFGSSRSYLQ